MTFVKGQPKPANGGRRKGTPNKGSVRARRLVAEGNDKAIVDEIVEGAVRGDRAAQLMYFRFIRPPRPKLNPTPIALPRPESIEDVRAIVARLVVEVLAGKLDLDAAGAASALLKAMESSIVGVDLKQLLDELKAKTST
jgi:hypothetical protein